jgi:hypothetical protein
MFGVKPLELLVALAVIVVIVAAAYSFKER